MFLISLLVTVSVSAQSVHILTDSASAPINTYAVLPDQGYTLDQVRTDTTLRFVLNDSLRPAQTRSYWLRLVVANPAHDDERYNLSLHPSLHNTLYYFDANRQRWISHQGGVDVPQKGRRDRNLMPFVAQGQAQTSLYIHVDLKLLPESDQSLKPKIIIEKQAATTSREQFLLITWITSLSVLFLFFLNNLFVYLSFRDKIVLYYLIEQVGGMIYITYYKDFFDVLFSGPFFTLGLSPSGYIHYFSLGSLLQHSSIVLMLYGLVQMTRAYFNTPITLPRLDSLLKTGLVMYGLFTAVILGINVGFVYGEDYTLKYHNMLAFLVIGSIMGTCVAGYRRRLPAAGAFLLANMLPLTFMLATTLFNVLMNGPTPKRSFLPDLVIITQSLAFSVALVARTKLIQKELTARKMEAQRLAFAMREMALSHRLTQLEIQKRDADIGHEKTRNELLQERLDMNQRELASTTLYMVQKNELLADLKAQLSKLSKRHPNAGQQGLKGLESILKSDQYLDADWGKFKIHFEQVHPHFFDNLLARHPALTNYEIRLYAYFHLNLSTKEIAALLNIDPASVRTAKTRLYKKMAAADNGLALKLADEEPNEPSDGA